MIEDFWAFALKHVSLFAMLFILFCVILIVEWLRSRQHRIQIDPNTTVRWLNHRHAVLIDTRDLTQFNQSHIIDALSLPKPSLEHIEKKLGKNKSKPVVFICDTPESSAIQQLVRRLSKAGYQARILKGGMSAWLAAQLPFVREEHS